MQGLKLSSKVNRKDASKLLTSKDGTHYLGCGSFGAVRLCQDEILGQVVVKCAMLTDPNKDLSKRQETVGREAEALSRMQHENIVKIHGYTCWDNNIGIVLEFLPGGNLDGFLFSDQGKKTSWSHRFWMAYQLILALVYLHNYEEGKVFCHTDLKPENILLDKGLNIKVADFGSVNLIKATNAKATNLSMPTTNFYTILYSAPECGNDNFEPSPAMDVYSFAMVLYEIITLTHIYSGAKLAQNILAIMVFKGARPNMETVKEVAEKQISDEDRCILNCLVDTMETCWKTDPGDRPASKQVEKELSKHLYLVDHVRIEREVAKLTQSSNNKLEVKPSSLVKLTTFSNPFIKSQTYTEQDEITENIKSLSLEEEELEFYNHSFLVVGGVGSERACVKYNIHSGKSERIKSLIHKRCCACSSIFNQIVMVFGGATDSNSGSESLKSVECFNQDNTFSFQTKMSVARKYAACAQIENFIYISGGLDGKTRLACNEILDTDTWEWQTLSDMLYERSAHGMTAIEDSLYCIGGFDTQNNNSCEHFDRRRKMWKEIAPMKHGRDGHSVVALDGMLYSIGGYSSSSMERYDPRVDKWEDLEPTLTQHYYGNAFTAQGKIFVVGGWKENSVEVYDPQQNSWQFCFNTREESLHSTVVALS